MHVINSAISSQGNYTREKNKDMSKNIAKKMFTTSVIIAKEKKAQQWRLAIQITDHPEDRL